MSISLSNSASRHASLASVSGPSPRAGRGRQNSISLRSAAMSSKLAGPLSPAQSPHGRPATGSDASVIELDAAFFVRMERLEDLVCQDILYVLHEFFSALHGKRSATRLPQGITSLLTQFTASVHLHLLGNVILTSETVAEYPGAAARKVNESLARLKQKRMAGKAFRTEHVSDTSVSRLIRSIEQYRLTKFILFDCWIIPALNNAVGSGYLSEGSSMHLRWNIDAFARYLKILVNAPFLGEHSYEAQARQSAWGGGDNRSPSASPGNGPSSPLNSPEEPSPTSSQQAPQDAARASDLSTDAGARQLPQARKKRKTKEGSSASAPPCTLPLPRYITGIYDVSSGSLVHVRAPSDEAAFQESGNSLLMNDTAFAANKSQTMMPEGRTAGGAGTPVQKSNARDEFAQLSSPVRVASRVPPSMYVAVSTRSGVAPSPAKAAAAPTMRIYTVMDDSDWEGISSSMKGLNEALGIVGYDPEDLTDMLGAPSAGGSHNLSGGSADGMMGGVSFGEKYTAMRVLDMFCRRASVENAHNVVVSELEVLPTMAAGCIDKVYEMMTGQHPLIDQVRARGTLPNTFGFSPYLACLHGVLLHPKSAARVLDNVYYNANRFYQTLMRPVQDEGLVSLVSALVVDQDDLPVVDSNALMPLLASVQRPDAATLQAHGRKAASTAARLPAVGAPVGSPSAARALPPSTLPSQQQQQQQHQHQYQQQHQQQQSLMMMSGAELLSAHARWEAEARKLKQQRLFLATGAVHTGSVHLNTVQAALDRVGPADPFRVLKGGNELIQREARVVPACFDPWWRAMVLALCVKAMGVFEECSPDRARTFERWYMERAEDAYRDNRAQRNAFILHKGRQPDGHEGRAAGDHRRSSSGVGSGRSSTAAASGQRANGDFGGGGNGSAAAGAPSSSRSASKKQRKRNAAVRRGASSQSKKRGAK